MSKTHALIGLARSLVDLGISQGQSTEAQTTARKEFHKAASGCLEALPSRVHARAQGLQSTLRKSAGELRSRMERQAGPAGSPVSEEVAGELLMQGLQWASEKLVNHSSSQVARVEALSDPQASIGATGLRAQLKDGLKMTLAIQTQRLADPLATKLAQGAAYVRRETQASEASRLSHHTAAVLSPDDLVSFKAGLLALPPEMRARPLFALALNSWSYDPALRAKACETFHDVRDQVPDDGAGRLSKLAMHPEAVDIDRAGAEAWLLASRDERSLLAQAFALQHDIGRGQVEARVVLSTVADGQIAASEDLPALAQHLGFETEVGLEALQTRRNELKVQG